MSSRALQSSLPSTHPLFLRTLRLLQKRHRLCRLKLLAMLLLGLPLSFLPVLLYLLPTCCFPMPIGKDGLSTCLILAMITPFLFLIEYRTRGEFLVTQMREIGTTSTDALLHQFAPIHLAPRSHFKAHAAAFVGIIEILLTGPRIVLSAVDQFLALSRLGPPDLPRCAQILLRLHASNISLDIPDLLLPDEPPSHLHHALYYLRIQNWIDFDTPGQRTWLLSNMRPLLTRL